MLYRILPVLVTCCCLLITPLLFSSCNAPVDEQTAENTGGEEQAASAAEKEGADADTDFRETMAAYNSESDPEKKVQLWFDFLDRNQDSTYTGGTVNWLINSHFIGERNDPDAALDFLTVQMEKLPANQVERIAPLRINLWGKAGMKEKIRAHMREMETAGRLDNGKRLKIARAAYEADDLEFALEQAKLVSQNADLATMRSEAPEASETQLLKRLDERIHDVHVLQGWIHEKQENWQQAARAYGTAVEHQELNFLGTSPEETANYFGRALLESGRPEAAMDAVQRKALMLHDTDSLELFEEAWLASGGAEEQLPAEKQRRLDTLYMQLPSFTAVNYAGEAVGFDELRGSKVTLVNFWFPTCPPCLTELPLLKEMYARLKDRGLEIVVVDAHRDTETAQKVIDENELPYLFVENGEGASEFVTSTFGITSFPTSLIVDADGRVISVHIGFSPGGEIALEKEIEVLLAE